MSKRNIVLGIGMVTAVSILVGSTYFFGTKHGADSMTIRRATPHDLAEAMKGDYFYASYRENTLVVTGTVASVNHSGSTTTVDFVSDSSYHVQCNFNDTPLNVAVGSKIKIIAEGQSGVRDPNGVTLKDCLEP